MILNGWKVEKVSDRCIVQIPEDHPSDGSDERVEVYTCADGQWYRTYVEPLDHEAPSVVTELVTAPPLLVDAS